MELTTEEKALLLQVLGQLKFAIGESETARKYEVIVDKLKTPVVDKSK